jgi:hypothetical protein
LDHGSGTLVLKTSNVSAFRITRRLEATIIIDKMPFHQVDAYKGTLFRLDKNNKWKVNEEREERIRIGISPFRLDFLLFLGTD